MPLDKDFTFSANSLQDYVDCPRRFELKYILNQSWPAIISEPVQEIEDKMARGSEFHRLARQYLEGLPLEILESSIKDPEIHTWFERFTAFISPYLKTRYFAEFASHTRIGAYRVVAVFDFLSISKEGQIIIADWKTTESQPKREFYQDRIQTLLYPVVAFDTASAIFHIAGKIDPGDISLLYWFPAFPEKSLDFPFSFDQLQRNTAYLSGLIDKIENTVQGGFSKTEDLRRCKFCQYRSLCERGIEAGVVEAADDLDIDELIKSMSFDLPE